MGKVDVLARAEAAPWLRPHFVSDEGYLKQKIQCLVVEVGDQRIAVDTCVGNHKNRPDTPPWHMRDGPFLESLGAMGVAPEDVDFAIGAFTEAGKELDLI